MLAKIFGAIAVVGLMTTLVSCEKTEQTQASLPQPTTESTTKKTLAIADVSSNPTKKIKRFQPLADYIAANLSEFGFEDGTVKIAPDLETIAKWLKSGEVTVYFDSPYPAMMTVEASGAQPILRRWKKGDAEFNSVIFTMSQGGAANMGDLRGKIVAFDHLTSTTGYLLPTVELLNAGLKPVEKATADSRVAPTEVGYVFSDDDENTVQWVISGKADAGAVDNQTFESIPEETRAAMTILAESEKVPRHVVLVSPTLTTAQVNEIKKILVEMDQTSEGQDILSKFENTAKFDELPYQRGVSKMKELYEQVQNR